MSASSILVIANALRLGWRGPGKVDVPVGSPPAGMRSAVGARG